MTLAFGEDGQLPKVEANSEQEVAFLYLLNIHYFRIKYMSIGLSLTPESIRGHREKEL